MSKARQKGTAFESLIAEYLRQTGTYPDIERAPLWGSADEGDFLNTKEFTIQAKNHAQMSLGAWVDQAEEQNSNYMARHRVIGRLPVVIHKRRGRGNAADQFVTMSLGDFATLCRWIHVMQKGDHLVGSA